MLFNGETAHACIVARATVVRYVTIIVRILAISRIQHRSMGLFSRIKKCAIPKTIASISFGILLANSSFNVHAVSELIGDAIPLGSHSDAHAQFANARHLWQTGKLKQAAALYESLIERFPKLPDAYNNLAVIYASQGDFKKAQQILEKGLNTHEGYAAIYENLTAIYVEMARDSYGKALQFADKPGRQLKLRALAELSLKSVQVAQIETPVTEKNSEVVTPGGNTDQQEDKAGKPAVLTATTSVKPLQNSVVKPNIESVDKSKVMEVLQSWASAWSAQSPDQYLMFYDKSYHPPGMSRKTWKARRIERIKKPQWIRVALSDMTVDSAADQRVRVTVKQRYQSNTFSDVSQKEFILFLTEDGWRIVSERNL